MISESKARLYVLFSLGKDRYALPASDVVEVLPIRPFKSIPAAPEWLLGCFVDEQHSIAVVDVAKQLLGVHSAVRTSTRLVVVEVVKNRRLALMLEKASETVRIADELFVDTHLANQVPFLGPVAQTPWGLIQKVEARALLSQNTLQWLFERLEHADA